MKKNKLLTTGLIITLLSFSNIFTTLSYANDTDSSIETESVETQSDSGQASWPSGPGLTAESAVLMDAATGTILYDKNMNEEEYPASITKVLTALVVLENCSLDETVTYSHNAIYDVDADSSRIWVLEGEELTVEQSLYALMLESANDVAYGLAEHVSGSVDEFVNLMNEKAVELGCKNSHFNNPHGLPNDNHYTSAYDMALITKAALQNEDFRKITSTQTYTLPPTNLQTETRYFTNHHKMLEGSSYSYDGCEGGKTGYTTAAGSTLVTYAKRGDLELICVILKDSTPEHYNDTETLLDWGFDNFKVYNISENETNYQVDTASFFDTDSTYFGEESSLLSINAKGTIVLPNNTSFTDATSSLSWDTDSSTSSIIGTLCYTYGNRTVGAASIDFSDSITDAYDFDYTASKEQSSDSSLLAIAANSTKKAFSLSLPYKIIIGLALIGVIFIYKRIRFVQRRQYERLRRHRRRKRRNRTYKKYDDLDDIYY